MNFISCLTPPGRSAVATIGLMGPKAWLTTRKYFQSRVGKTLPATSSTGKIWFGRLGDQFKDDVVVATQRNEHVEWIEIHSHGGNQVADYLQQLYGDEGFIIKSWPEFLRQILPAWQASAAKALAQATTPRTAGILLDQYRGAFHQAIKKVAEAFRVNDFPTAAAELDNLAYFANFARHLTSPWQVVIAGAPNVGKSSLLNAIAGFQRSIVAALPGTTRDSVRITVALDGWPVELIDTAGLHESADALEQAGIERSRSLLDTADLVVWVMDLVSKPVLPPKPLPKILHVINKIDLPESRHEWPGVEAIGVSAATGEGLTKLLAALVTALVPTGPAPGAAVPYTALLAATIEKVRSELLMGKTAAASELLNTILES